VRASANLKARTVEELHTQKKDMHLNAFRYLLADTDRELELIADDTSTHDRLARDPFRTMVLQDWITAGGREEYLLPGMSDGTVVTFSVKGLLARIKTQCKAVLKQHKALAPEHYNDDEAFRRIVAEMLETRAAAVATLRGYLEDPGVYVKNVMRGTIAYRHRVYLAYLERTLPTAGEARVTAAGRLCRFMGVMQSSADEPDAEGLTPLMCAAADRAGWRALRCLVAARADVNRRDERDGQTALYLAARCGHAEVVEELARLRGDVNLTANRGGFDGSPMWIAAHEDHDAVIEFLGRLGADANLADSDGRTSVFVAAEKGHTASIEALGRLGADVNRAARSGSTPLRIATDNGHAGAADALRRLGAAP
jgi:hypothetical protein